MHSAALFLPLYYLLLALSLSCPLHLRRLLPITSVARFSSRARTPTTLLAQFSSCSKTAPDPPLTRRRTHHHSSSAPLCCCCHTDAAKPHATRVRVCVDGRVFSLRSDARSEDSRKCRSKERDLSIGRRRRSSRIGSRVSSVFPTLVLAALALCFSLPLFVPRRPSIDRQTDDHSRFLTFTQSVDASRRLAIRSTDDARCLSHARVHSPPNFAFTLVTDCTRSPPPPPPSVFVLTFPSESTRLYRRRSSKRNPTLLRERRLLPHSCARRRRQVDTRMQVGNATRTVARSPGNTWQRLANTQPLAFRRAGRLSRA